MPCLCKPLVLWYWGDSKNLLVEVKTDPSFVFWLVIAVFGRGATPSWHWLFDLVGHLGRVRSADSKLLIVEDGRTNGIASNPSTTVGVSVV